MAKGPTTDFGAGFGTTPTGEGRAAANPYSGAAGFFATLINDAHNRSEQAKGQWEADRDAEVNMYRGIVLAPPGQVTDEQREKAAKQMDKLLNLKPGIWHPLSQHLNTLSNTLHQAGGGAAPPATGAAPATTPTPAAPSPHVDPIKEGFARKTLNKIGEGLDTGLGLVETGLLGPHYPSLPPMDASVFTGITPLEQQQQILEAKQANVRKLVSEGMSIDDAMAMAGMKPPNEGHNYLRKGMLILGSKLPENAVGPNGPITDGKGNLTGEGLRYGPNQAWFAMIPTVPGSPTIYYPASVPAKFVTGGNRVWPVNPYTNQITDNSGQAVGSIFGMQKNLGTTHEVQAVAPSGVPIAQKLTTAPITAPMTGQKKTRSKVLPEIVPPQHRPEGKAEKRTKRTMPEMTSQIPAGARALPGFSPGVFTTQSKAATGINESYSAVFGDDPHQAGGLFAHMDVFNNPKDMKQLGEYFTMQEQYLRNASDVPKGDAVQYFAGVPLYLSNEKAQYLKRKYDQMSPDAREFADYWTRAVAAAPGLRSATSAPSALAALQQIHSEYPAPPFVNNYNDAMTRLYNLYNVMHEAAINNPILRGNLAKHYDPFTDPNGPVVQVQIPGEAPGWIPRSALPAFKKKYPNGKVLIGGR